MFLIEVDGDIIIRGGHQWAMDWVCGASAKTNSQKVFEHRIDRYSPLDFDNATHRINGDLVLSKTRRSIPYAVYYAHGDILIDPDATDAFDGCGGPYHSSLAYWEESIESIKKRLDYSVDDILKTTVLNGLYVECFGSLELLLCDLLLASIFTNEGCYERAIDYWIDNHEPIKDELSLERKIHEEFSRIIVYHQFDRIGPIFQSILGIELPNTSDLSNLLHKRHNIVHRRSLSNLDFMSSTNATISDVKKLLYTMENFVGELTDRILLLYSL